MDDEKIKELLKVKNEIFIYKIDLINKSYVQAVKLKSNKIQYIYYQIENNELKQVEDKDKLKFLREKYEQKQSSIVYDEEKIEEKQEYQKKYRIKQDNSKQQENPDLKPWLKEFVEEKLKNCELFTSVYGKNYAKKKMNSLENVYVREKDDKYITGNCILNEKIINVYLKTDDEYYSISDLKNNEQILAIILHEGVHYVLKYGDFNTGMMMLVSSNQKDETSNAKTQFKIIGRALNEGLTDWIVEQAGLGRHVGFEYSLYLNLIKQIELAIGKEKTMKLGKCKLSGIHNISKLLKMKKEKVIDLLLKTDAIKIQYNEFRKANKIVQDIEKYENIDKVEDEIKREEIELNFFYIQNSLEEKKDDYLEFLKNNNLKPSVQNLKEYYKKICKIVSNNIYETYVTCECIIYEHFFKKEYEEMLKEENISKDKFKKYFQLYDLINGKKDPNNLIGQFKISFENIVSKYLLAMTKQMNIKYEKLNLTFSNFLKLMDKINNEDESKEVLKKGKRKKWLTENSVVASYGEDDTKIINEEINNSDKVSYNENEETDNQR